MLSRLLELTVFATHRDSAMASIFCLFASCPESQRRTILYKLYTFTQPSKTVATFIVDYLLYCFSKASNGIQSNKSLLNTLNTPSVSSSLVTSSNTCDSPSSSSISMACNFSSVREVLQCIQQILSLNSHYYEQFVVNNLLNIVQVVIENPSSYEGKVEAGRCLVIHHAFYTRLPECFPLFVGYLLCEILKRSGGEVDVLQVCYIIQVLQISCNNSTYGLLIVGDIAVVSSHTLH
ncbi:hypothetical protein EON65_08135 [archaeon]|nr:MAG: hypothetical protein EON65_08135 [archaeon]